MFQHLIYAVKIMDEIPSLETGLCITTGHDTDLWQSTAKKTKKSTSSSNARVNQARQAQADKARAAAASASVMAEKVEAAKSLAKSAQTALVHSAQALQVIFRICEVARASVYSLTASMLSLTLPLAKVEASSTFKRNIKTYITLTISNNNHLFLNVLFDKVLNVSLLWRKNALKI